MTSYKICEVKDYTIVLVVGNTSTQISIHHNGGSVTDSVVLDKEMLNNSLYFNMIDDKTYRKLKKAWSYIVTKLIKKTTRKLGDFYVAYDCAVFTNDKGVPILKVYGDEYRVTYDYNIFKEVKGDIEDMLSKEFEVVK